MAKTTVVPTWIDFYVSPPKVGELVTVLPKGDGSWRVRLDNEPVPGGVVLKVIRVIESALGWAVKVERYAAE